MGLPPNLITGRKAKLPGVKAPRKRSGLPAEESWLEARFLFLWPKFSGGLPAPVRGHRFHGTKKWELDFAWPEYKLAVEMEGGTHSKGRHVRADGYRGDCEKYDAAIEDGWRVLRYTDDDMRQRPVQVVEAVARILRKQICN